MKKNKLFSRLTRLFNKRKDQQRQELQASLLLLKQKQKQLKEQLEHCCTPEERQALQEKISILQAQRFKGINKLRQPDEPS